MTITMPAPTFAPTRDSTTWSPGPGYVEILPAAWARPFAHDQFEVVVLTSADEQDGLPALASGVLSETLLLLADYWMHNPGELRLLAIADLLQLREIGPEHPVLGHAEARLGHRRYEIQPEAWTALGLTADDAVAADLATHTVIGDPPVAIDAADLPF